MRNLDQAEIDLVSGGIDSVEAVRNAGKAVGRAIFNFFDSAVNSYVESANQMETSTDYESHPDYIGIGGPF